MGVPSDILANFWSTLAGQAVYCKIYDVTNGNQICEGTTVSNDPTLFTSLGALTFLPAGAATFEVQIKAPTSQCQIGGVIVEY